MGRAGNDAKQSRTRPHGKVVANADCPKKLRVHETLHLASLPWGSILGPESLASGAPLRMPPSVYANFYHGRGARNELGHVHCFEPGDVLRVCDLGSLGAGSGCTALGAAEDERQTDGLDLYNVANRLHHLAPGGRAIRGQLLEPGMD